MESAPAYGYCKTLQDLEKMRRIKHRGLAKVMWGKSLNQIGVQIPIHIQRLMSHKNSPALEALDYSTTTLEEDKVADTVTVSVENKAENIERFANYAKLEGLKSVRDNLNHRLAALIKREVLL